ncbi:MAG: hypothetical protein V7749_08020, partial [Cocleimonas sp.]
LSTNILLQNTSSINVQELDVSAFVEVVPSLSIDVTADCSAITELEFSPAVGEVILDGRVLSATSSLCVEATYAQVLKTQYAQVLSAQGMSNADVFKSCTVTETCENLRIAIFTLSDNATGESYGMQLELLSETETSDPYLTLLTIVGEGKLEYYGEVISGTTVTVSPISQITSSLATLASLDIKGLDIKKKDQKALEKRLQKKGATRALNKALKPKFWSSETTLTERGGDVVFKKVANAVKNISKAKKLLDDQSSDPSALALLDTLNELQASLAGSMRALAADRIAEAQAANGNQGSIEMAITQLADGDAFVDVSKFDKAIKSYGDSWNELSGAY